MEDESKVRSFPIQSDDRRNSLLIFVTLPIHFAGKMLASAVEQQDGDWQTFDTVRR
jgi:hypothetical protein